MKKTIFELTTSIAGLTCLILCFIGLTSLLPSRSGQRLAKPVVDTVAVYDMAITGTRDGCPCSYEVWQTTALTFGNGDDDWIVDEDAWHIIFTKNDCPTKIGN